MNTPISSQGRIENDRISLLHRNCAARYERNLPWSLAQGFKTKLVSEVGQKTETSDFLRMLR